MKALFISRAEVEGELRCALLGGGFRLCVRCREEITRHTDPVAQRHECIRVRLMTAFDVGDGLMVKPRFSRSLPKRLSPSFSLHGDTQAIRVNS